MSKLSTGRTTSSSFPLTSLISASVSHVSPSALASCRQVSLTVLAETVGADDHLSLIKNVGHVDTDNKLGSGF